MGALNLDAAVIGGSYRERVRDPFVNVLGGSGLRATRLLKGLGDEVSFFTAIDEGNRAEFDSQCSLFGFSAEVHKRNSPIEFHYETPIDKPIHYCHAEAESEVINVDASDALLFGMLEASPTVRAEIAVIDPQHSPAQRLLEGVNADHTTILLNEHEARRFTGETHLRSAALKLLNLEVEAVVVKQGARGGFVASSGEYHRFGVVPTTTVNPLGSGDAFSAGFFHAWALERRTIVEAADFASRVAAAHSLISSYTGSLSVLDSVPEPTVFKEDVMARVYLAAPFFNVGERGLMRKARDALRGLGVEVFSPFDEIGDGADEVAEKDLRGLEGCHALLALLPGADAGTLFETGWATRAGIPIVGYDGDQKSHSWTMLRGTGALITNDLSTAIYQAAWKALSRGES